METYFDLIVSRITVSDSTLSVWCNKPSNFKYTAGQYVIIYWQGQEKYMTLASAPSEPELLFVMKPSDSAFKQSMLSLKPHDNLKVSAADGGLTIDHITSQHHHFFLAAGVGVTPFRSMLHELRNLDNPPKVTLLYSTKSAAKASFYDEFMDMSRQTWFTFKPIVTSDSTAPLGRIDEGTLKSNIPVNESTKIYIAGSHDFISSISAILIESLHIPKKSIVAEVFCGYCPLHVCCCNHVSAALTT